MSAEEDWEYKALLEFLTKMNLKAEYIAYNRCRCQTVIRIVDASS